MDNETLTISIADVTHTGEYVCTADNGITSQSQVIVLQVLGKYILRKSNIYGGDPLIFFFYHTHMFHGCSSS